MNFGKFLQAAKAGEYSVYFLPVKLGTDGLPRRITSHYNTGNTAIVDADTEVLGAPRCVLSS